MNRRRLAALAAALLFVVAPLARAEEATVVASRITAVTVYEDRALVTRTSALELGAGTSRVVLEHLPAGLDGPSLRARARGAQVLGVEIEAVFLERENSAALRGAQDALENAQRASRDAEMDNADAVNRWEVLRSISAKSAEGASRELGQGSGPDVTALAKLLDFIEKRSVNARRDVARSEVALARAAREVEAATRRVEELRGAGAREERRAVVTLRTETEGETTLEVSYLIHGASWRPVYALRVAEDFRAALLELGAEVQQATGEDWSDVQLELTTARPAAGAAPPEPTPWRIRLPRAERGTVAGEARAPRAATSLDDAAPIADAKRLEMIVNRSGLVVAFGAHRPETVKSGARPSQVSLGQFELEPTVVWTVFPRATPDVFVQAKITNTTGSPLPAGEARVFVGPDYVGPLSLADWGADEELRVGLGVDRQIVAEREEILRRRETEGLFSKVDVHTRRYRITVKNHRARKITARVLDQIPVSGDEDLEVELTESSLPQAELPKREAETNAARGILEWRQSVTAGGTLDIRFAFEVRHPKGESASGLD